MNKEQSPESLLTALKAERASVKAAREELESLNRQIGDRDRELNRLAAIDPHKYAELSAWQQELEEQELRENQDWGKLKANYQKEKGDLNTQIQTWQNKYQGILTQQAIKDAFVATGGITKADDGEVSPLDLVTQYFADRVQVKDEKIRPLA
jgi:phage host-nuclease inhibitor protein Gam